MTVWVIVVVAFLSTGSFVAVAGRMRRRRPSLSERLGPYVDHGWITDAEAWLVLTAPWNRPRRISPRTPDRVGAAVSTGRPKVRQHAYTAPPSRAR